MGRGGCWPHDVPAWQAVYARFRLWRLAGAWDAAHAALREGVRVEAGRPPSPETPRVDSQTVRTARRGGPKGYGGGERAVGRRRVAGVGSLGLVWAPLVTPASDRDRGAGRWRLGAARHRRPRVRGVVATSGFGRRFVECARRVCRRRVAVTAKAADGSRVRPRRWAVERTFGWLVGFRRLRVEYEYHPGTSEAVIQAAMIDLMLRRLHPPA